MNALTKEQIREIFLANGFTIKEGSDDLKPYVYEAARALLAAEKSLAAPTAQTNQKPYGWLTGESISHRQGIMQELITNYEWAKEICDKNNAENRFIDPDWVDEAPVPLYVAAQAVNPDMKVMVDRFLGWKLPDDFNPDGGIVFFKKHPYGPGKYEPIGTNLFTADQAKAMFEYCLTTGDAAIGEQK